jgi:hypothetical protein
MKNAIDPLNEPKVVAKLKLWDVEVLLTFCYTIPWLVGGALINV